MGLSNKDKRSYKFWDVARQVSNLSSILATLLSVGTALLSWHMGKPFSWWPIAMYVLGALLGHLLLVRSLLEKEVREEQENLVEGFAKIVTPDRFRADTKEYRQIAIWGHPFLFGFPYTVFKIVRFLTSSSWTAVPFFAGVGWALGGLVHRPIGFAVVGIFVAILIAYKRKHPGLPPAPATT